MKKIITTLSLVLICNSIFCQSSQLWGFTSDKIFHMNYNATVFDTVHTFVSATGTDPRGNLLLASNGKFYGVCKEGGLFASCTIFSFDPATNSFADEHDFLSIPHDGDFPRSSVIEATNGKLYGVCLLGGTNNRGVIYSFNLINNSYAVEYNFDSIFTAPASPNGSLIQSSNGKLYGMTLYLGPDYTGAIYSFDPVTSTFTDLHHFNHTNGAIPLGNLVKGNNGFLYGMTSDGGTNNDGVIFSFDPFNNSYTKLHDFNKIDGAHPFGSLKLTSNNKFYGMTNQGGAGSVGVIFSFDPSNNNYQKLFDFDTINGAGPWGDLMEASNGDLYGMTMGGGNPGIYSWGVIFRYNIISNTFTKLMNFDTITGGGPRGGLIEVITTGIESISSANNISIFPNPFSNKLTISIQNKSSKQTTFTIRNILGIEVLFKQENILSNFYSRAIDLNFLVKGIYLLEINIDGERTVKKIVKQ